VAAEVDAEVDQHLVPVLEVLVVVQVFLLKLLELALKAMPVAAVLRPLLLEDLVVVVLTLLALMVVAEMVVVVPATPTLMETPMRAEAVEEQVQLLVLDLAELVVAVTVVLVVLALRLVQAVVL
jgi:hypothetical protein